MSKLFDQVIVTVQNLKYCSTECYDLFGPYLVMQYFVSFLVFGESSKFLKS